MGARLIKLYGDADALAADHRFRRAAGWRIAQVQVCALPPARFGEPMCPGSRRLVYRVAYEARAGSA